MTKISFFLATYATIYIILSPGLLATAARENLHHQCFCDSSSKCACFPPPLTQPTSVNKPPKSAGPLCLSDGDCKHFCSPKKGVCNIDFETCVCH
ncbi:hypothetical protein ISN45_Aa08g020040 [Arabidopsis thaliana x Arabidopsis arenosa]|uniref:Uncharacterized protein n=1 Tax=Arabidopsis thaliana x Arabidopsis arenosa TaxID=1240361 RepID=A0A8T1XJW6_9BRAS|nr:hypothetical protein ISN45_Aa08g020040 [Arabidopsis thaliana x Arabidopsis arenosa]